MAKVVQLEPEVSGVDFTPEDNLQSKSFADEQAEEFKRKCKMWAASCEVEIDRIERENGVRIGNSILAESYAKSEIISALKKVQEKYLSLC